MADLDDAMEMGSIGQAEYHAQRTHLRAQAVALLAEQQKARGAMIGWGAVIVVAIGLAAGWLIHASLMVDKRLPGGVWAAGAGGIIGALLGAFVPGKWGWVTQEVNVIMAGLTALPMAYIVARIEGYWFGRDSEL